jgi:D-glycero-beta-D-manno-heptose-7-phosphate kinase
MKFNHIKEVFEAFNSLKVLIIGDVMVDAYDWGKVERISPEAPVPIIHLTKRENRLGGAGNVALNIQALGATPILCTVIGNDMDGSDLLGLLSSAKMSQEGIVRSSSRITTTKRRVIAGSQHLVRIDSETDELIAENDRKALLDKIKSLVTQVDVVIFEDYDKGVISKEIIENTVTLCRANNIPITVDPKKRNFLNYQGVSLFKPNLKELKEGLKIDFNPDNLDEITSAVNQLNEKLGAEKYLITLSERGVYMHSKEKIDHIPAHKREISDVSGAGDTVISVASLCLALKLPQKMTAEISNLSGGLVCEFVGAVPIDKKMLQSESERLNLFSSADL